MVKTRIPESFGIGTELESEPESWQPYRGDGRGALGARPAHVSRHGRQGTKLNIFLVFLQNFRYHVIHLFMRCLCGAAVISFATAQNILWEPTGSSGPSGPASVAPPSTRHSSHWKLIRNENEPLPNLPLSRSFVFGANLSRQSLD